MRYGKLDMPTDIHTRNKAVVRPIRQALALYDYEPGAVPIAAKAGIS